MNTFNTNRSSGVQKSEVVKRQIDDDTTYTNPKAWAQVKAAFASDPMIATLIRRLEQAAGTGDVRLWFAGALYEFVAGSDEPARQQAILQAICADAGTECKLMY